MQANTFWKISLAFLVLIFLSLIIFLIGLFNMGVSLTSPSGIVLLFLIFVVVCVTILFLLKIKIGFYLALVAAIIIFIGGSLLFSLAVFVQLVRESALYVIIFTLIPLLISAIVIFTVWKSKPIFCPKSN